MSAQEVANTIQMTPEVPVLVPRSEITQLLTLNTGLRALLILAVVAVFAMQFMESRALRKELQANHKLMVAELQTTQASVRASFNEDVIFLKILHLRSGISHKLARIIAIAVAENARAFDRDPDFILSIISRESHFETKIVSPAGAVGLMQIMPPWVKIVGKEEDLTIPAVSIRRGLQIYAFYEKEFGNNTEKALTAYNRGSGPVWKDMVDGRDWKRNGYAAKVMKTYARLKKLAQ